MRELNRMLSGWANYFGQGYPRMAFRRINHYVRTRLSVHLRRRSQRRYRPPKGTEGFVRLVLRVLYLAQRTAQVVDEALGAHAPGASSCPASQGSFRRCRLRQYLKVSRVDLLRVLRCRSPRRPVRA